MLFRPTLSSIKAAITTLQERRSYPDPVLDEQAFIAKWAGKNVLPKLLESDSDDFRHGKLPHQQTLTRSVEGRLSDLRNIMDAIANETNGYLTTFALLSAGAGFMLSGGRLDVFLQSSQRFWLWAPAIIVVLLLLVHGSRLWVLFENRPGPGAAADDTEFARVNGIRETALRYHGYTWRARRLLAGIHLLFILLIVAACAVLTWW